MKSFIYILIISVAAVCVECESPEEMKKIMQECKTEFGISEKPARLDMNDLNAKCFFACIMEKSGKMVDGKGNLEKMWELHQKMDPKADDTVKEKMSNCIKTGNEKSERCEVAGTITKCIQDNILNIH